MKLTKENMNQLLKCEYKNCQIESITNDEDVCEIEFDFNLISNHIIFQKLQNNYYIVAYDLENVSVDDRVIDVIMSLM